MDLMEDKFGLNTLGTIILDLKSLDKSVKFASLVAGFFEQGDRFDRFIHRTYVRTDMFQYYQS